MSSLTTTHGVLNAILGGVFVLFLLAVIDRGIFYQVCLLLSIPNNLDPRRVWKTGADKFFKPVRTLLSMLTAFAFFAAQLTNGTALFLSLGFAALAFLAFVLVSSVLAIRTFRDAWGASNDE